SVVRLLLQYLASESGDGPGRARAASQLITRPRQRANSQGSMTMKATDLLTQQHKKVKAIFKKLEKGSGDAAELLEELANDLAAHMAIEHELFYPAVIDLDEKMVHEPFEEHALGEIAIKRLLSADPE